MNPDSYTADIRDRLQALADEDGDRVCIREVCDSGDRRSMTSRQLAAEVEALVAPVTELAGKADGRALICTVARNELDVAVILLASLCAGVPVFPHPPKFDRTLLADVLSTAGAELVSERVRLHSETQWRGHDPYHVALAHGGREDAPTYYLATSGSTGTPKMIPFWDYRPYDRRRVPDAVYRTCGWRERQRQLIVLPVYHIGNLAALVQGILSGNEVILGDKLSAEAIVAALLRHRPEWTILTPPLMERLTPLVEADPDALRSLETVIHTALPCPPRLKWAWIDLLGPERLYELYGGTEGVGVTLIRGTEWADRPGSLGRGFLTAIRVLDTNGDTLPAGGLGEIYLKRLGAAPRRNATVPWLRTRDDGYISLGDIGWVDEDGYLFLFDRVANRVATASGEAWLGRASLVLRACRGVADAECVAVADGDEHNQIIIKALVVLDEEQPIEHECLLEYLRGHLSEPERPIEFSYVPGIPRSEIGKPDWLALRTMTGQPG